MAVALGSKEDKLGRGPPPRRSCLEPDLLPTVVQCRCGRVDVFHAFGLCSALFRSVHALFGGSTSERGIRDLIASGFSWSSVFVSCLGVQPGCCGCAWDEHSPQASGIRGRHVCVCVCVCVCAHVVVRSCWPKCSILIGVPTMAWHGFCCEEFVAT